MEHDAAQTPIERRAQLHAALGDRHRLAIVEALTLGDCSPSDLASDLGIRSNLLAHHLQVLGDVGLIETVRSSGDGRRRYVTLRPRALEELRLPVAPFRPSLVLFVCSANSARSPIAAALWRRSGREAVSAGTHPAARIHPLAVAAAARHGLDIANEKPRALETLEVEPDLVVTVCDEANEELGTLESTPRLHWSVPDPVAGGTRAAFEAAVGLLTERVERLARREASDNAEARQPTYAASRRTRR
ncbi:MAG: helix-turn-helix domain-containing protein [Dehalococcoidia bacterium]